jgi:hypothetical protein
MAQVLGAAQALSWRLGAKPAATLHSVPKRDQGKRCSTQAFANDYETVSDRPRLPLLTPMSDKQQRLCTRGLSRMLLSQSALRLY